MNSTGLGETQPQVITLEAKRILQLLSEGEMEVQGHIPWSSNATLLVIVQKDDISSLAVYKPHRGERPLWDFPYGSLGNREVATYLVSEAMGWGMVPPTVLRQGPYGVGSVQFYVQAQEDLHFFTIRDDPAYVHDLMRLAALDVITNNADRKSGHCLMDQNGRLWAIDNALTFHTEPKLRTVIWDFAGLPLPSQVLSDLGGLQETLTTDSALTRTLGDLLSKAEIMALGCRLQQLIQSKCYPIPGPGRVVPWPLV